MNDAAFCEEMLPRVSRTFALCIRLLPPDLEYPVLVAYLLCRIADTIEDTADLDGDSKGILLHSFGDWLENKSGPGKLLETFARRRNDEELLAHHADSVVREYRRLPADQQHAILPWVREMADGMAQFAQKRTEDGVDQIYALKTVEDLDRYCYFVAGTVGHMLTGLYQTGGRSFDPERSQRLTDLATSFGLGLQLTNIIKDVGDDRERGWSFVPRDLCEAAGIEPRDLHNPEHADAARVVMNSLIDKAAGHLADAREYSQTLPRLEYRIRLFCLTSMFFAVKTLALARRSVPVLDPARKIKISRRSVYATVVGAALVAPSNPLIDFYYRRLSAT